MDKKGAGVAICSRLQPSPPRVYSLMKKGAVGNIIGHSLLSLALVTNKIMEEGPSNKKSFLPPFSFLGSNELLAMMKKGGGGCTQ